MDAQHLLNGLNAAQRDAVTVDAAPLCIVAGAGSGKTRVLTRRIAYRVATGQADAPHVLTLTFTRKAAGELRQRLAATGMRERVIAGTFHGVAYAQLRQRWADRGQTPPALVQSKLRLLVPLLGRHSRSAAIQPADIASEIEWAKARLVPPSQYAVEAEKSGRTPPLPAAQVATIYERYEAEKRRRRVIDFDDLLSLCARALEDDPDFAATQQWRFRHLFVDEFQDVNPAQFRVLKGWLGNGTDLCVVGDPNQAIYGWNGADPRLITNFGQLFTDSTTVTLEDNYRSTPQILAAANAVLGDRAGLRPNREDGPAPTITRYDDDVAESRGVATRLRRAHRPGTSWARLAVLTRTNAQLRQFEEAFRAVGIPYRLRGDGAFLSLPEVKDAIRAIRSAKAKVPMEHHLADLEAMAGASEGTPERLANLQQLLRMGRDYAELDPQGTVDGFAAWLSATLRGDDSDDGTADAVSLVTFHRAKGLEWPVVFVAGIERGLVPIGHAGSSDAVAEEQRLLYVALTRAEEELHCSWAARRTFGERTVPRSASPWLDEVRLVVDGLADGRPASDWRAMLANGRASIKAPTAGRPSAPRLGADADPALLAELKSWRSRMAKAANVPAYVIFHDTTLAAMAEVQPRDRDALIAIPGLGPVKADRYAADLLEVIAQHGTTA
ncbi:MAG: ATP-dependent helicase [Acidimicrobiales bacterium]